MKKAYVLMSVFFAVTLLISCSTSKEARSYRRTIDGNWQLSTVITEGLSGKIKAQVFNEEDFNCFVGSNWSFNQGNSLGYYSIDKNAGECVAIKRDLRWSIYEAADQPKLLQFKRLDAKLKEMDAGGGFRLTILQLTDKTMQLRSDVSFEGKPVSFIYNFIRI